MIGDFKHDLPLMHASDVIASASDLENSRDVRKKTHVPRAVTGCERESPRECQGRIGMFRWPRNCTLAVAGWM
jgi:hypothetical protein